jgi:hypothetical protein
MNNNHKYFLAGSAGAAFVALLILGVFNSSSNVGIEDKDQTANIINSLETTPVVQAVPACVPPDAVTGVTASNGSCSVSYCSGATATANQNMGNLSADLTNTSPSLLVEYADMCLGMVVNQNGDHIARPVAKFETNIVLDQATAGKSPELLAQMISQLTEIGVVGSNQVAFDATLIEAIKKFQTENGLTPTGYIDIATYSKIQHSIAAVRMKAYVNIVNKEAVKN